MLPALLLMTTDRSYTVRTTRKARRAQRFTQATHSDLTQQGNQLQGQ
jgi:hypothetical protein